MGFYNPSAPIILGEEWVPIREENLAFNEQVNNLEMGHTFALTTATQLSVGRFYVNKFPQSAMDNQAYTMAVYPKGLEDKSGPVHSVIIPCNAVGATGLPTQIGTLDNVTRVSNPSADPDLGILMNIGSATQKDVAFFFATNQYANLLANKRILGVNFLSNARFTNVNGVVPANVLVQTNGAFLQIRNEGNTNRWNFPLYADDFSPQRTNNPRTDRIGDVDRFFGGSVANVPDTIPLTYSMLQKFEATAGVTRIHMHMRVPASTPVFLGPFVYFNYAALEVFYCEETRVAYGTKIYNPWNQSPFLTDSPVMGGIPQQVNPIIMRDLSGNANPILQPGEYVVTVCEANLGDDLEVTVNAGPHAELNALRQLYEIPRLQGRSINIPFPLDSGATSTPHTFTATTSTVLPQISLHVSGGTPLPEVHVYGRQAIGQVYGTVFVTQDILDSVAGANSFYPWVRYYARRFGETTVPLRLSSTSPTVSGSGYSVSITPDEWDALPEILDRWKEVTLRFPNATPPVMGAGFTPQWRWTAVGEHKGNRWEVLGCVAPALSGLPGNLLNLAVPPVSQLGSATYGQPTAGTSVNMGWIPQYGPYVSATVDDTTADAVLLFSQDPAPVSGFSISTLSQALSGIGQQCNLNPMGIPTSLSYNRLTWTRQTALHVEQEFLDTFSRTAASTWGTADTGQVYQTSGGTAADYNVTGGVGTVALPTTAARNVYTGPAAGAVFTDVEYYAEVTVPALATGDVYDVVLMGREDFNNNNYYGLNAEFDTAGTIDVFVFKDVGGVFTTLATSLNAVPYAAGNSIGLRFRLVGTTILAKVWNRSTQTEPAAWTVTATDSSIASGGVGTLQSRSGSNTNVGLVISWDNISATDLTTQTFGAYELQRMDAVDNTWETIMLSSSSAVSGFNDYEARVGILSSYRIRTVNAYGFYGPWSSTLTATITAPGVAVGITGGHVLIFTTNSRQTGSSNLAYLPIWDSSTTIAEDFTFPEAGFLTLQAMYNKDFFTAFRPLERGGERFQRTVLVQAAAIAPETLADFTSLRNMAWDQVPYICVRDEDGNRWFAAINVPSARVQRGRRLYEATIDVIEVSDTPSQVDP